MEYQKKVFLMGGLGNKFFQVARALELQRKNMSVELVYIDPKMISLYKLGGHTIHPEWFDILILGGKLNLHVRPITFVELLFLGMMFVGKKVGLPICFNGALDSVSISKPALDKTSWDVGYFQHNLERPVGMKQKLVDVKLLRKFGWKNKRSLHEGLEIAYQFYLEDLQSGVVRAKRKDAFIQ